MNGIFLIIGGNMGDRVLYMNTAKLLIRKHLGEIILQSKLYETAAWGNESQAHYLNQILKIETQLEPGDLMEASLNIEKELGRIRTVKWESRPIDIDLLFYHNRIESTTNLTIPHPRIPERRFVLLPFCEIAASEVHPVLQETMGRLLDICPDSLTVWPYEGL